MLYIKHIYKDWLCQPIATFLVSKTTQVLTEESLSGINEIVSP